MPPRPDGTVRLAIDGPIAIVTLDRPAKLNALTLPMLHEFENAVGRLEQAHEVRAVILAGAGERAFCVGADIDAWGHLAEDDPVAMWQTWDRAGHRVLDRLASLPMPVIAALCGQVLGGGLEVALAADLRIGADDVHLGLPEVRVGTQPGWGGSRRLAALVGPARAKQMAFTAEPVDAATAIAWGLLNEVVPVERLYSRTLALGRQVAAHAPIAVALAKASIDGAAGSGTVLALEGMAGALGALTADGREGPAAFREKRAPRWTGR
ncbi:MAG: hypothetical protein A2V85_04320 [Chloroflexi bacterium RBG_16_72_14]|nr:MAG: hypothetical protein A2V85_04320 [Chloroflexi bacterium RBG_16_72_14]